MRITRALATGAGIAIIAVSALVVTSSATAAPEGGVEFVLKSSMATTDRAYGEYEATMWSHVDGPDGYSESQRVGYAMRGETSVTNFFEYAQFDETFSETSRNVYLWDSSVSNAQGVLYYSTDDGDSTQTLTSDALGTAGFSDLTRIWTSSAPFGSITTGTLSQFDDQISDADGWLSFYGAGVKTVTGGGTATITALTVDDVKYLFTPSPVDNAPPASLALATFSSSGYTATTTGFMPGEIINAVVTNDDTGETIDTTTPESNGLGEVTRGYRPAPADAIAGNYTLTFSSSDSDATRIQSFTFTVAAGGTEGAGGSDGTGDEVLAATGAEPTSVIAAAGALSVLGAGILTTVAIRRRKAIR